MTNVAAAAEALLDLLPAASGGLRAAIEAGFRSALLQFPGQPDECGDCFGVGIFPMDSEWLAPGQQGRVELRFWADLARVYGSTPGTPFVLLYGSPLRQVAQGYLLTSVELMPDRL